MTATLERSVAPRRSLRRSIRPETPDTAPNPPTARRRAPVGSWLIVVVAVGAGIRLWHIGASRFSYDEAFTAMAGRLPVGGLLDFITRHDSHPPVDYLIHAPFARAGVSEFWFRFPSAVMSIAAVALLAWWMRRRGPIAIYATAVMALTPFQIAHGRDARMYAELELVGVAVGMLTEAWLLRPRARHALLLGALVFAGLLTHVSMFLLAAGLLVVPGIRRDRAAWQWRGAIAGGGLAWAAVWGTHFVIQAQGGHSSWIPSTTPATLTTAIGRLLTFETTFVLAAVIVTVIGAVVLVRTDRRLGRVWIGCFVVPVVVGAIAGRFEPVVLDRTFTLMAWAPVVAVAFALDAVVRRHQVIGAVAFAGVVAVTVPSALGVITGHNGPDTPLRLLERRVRPGDIVAVRPLSKAPELQWSFGVQTNSSTRRVRVPGQPRAFGIRVGHHRPSGRTWLLDWNAPNTAAGHRSDCGPRWGRGHVRIRCLTYRGTSASR